MHSLTDRFLMRSQKTNNIKSLTESVLSTIYLIKVQNGTKHQNGVVQTQASRKYIQEEQG